MKNSKIICGCCGHTFNVAGAVVQEIYFPTRMIYKPGAARPEVCPACDWDADLIIFGTQYVSTNKQTPDVIENNKIYYATKK